MTGLTPELSTAGWGKENTRDQTHKLKQGISPKQATMPEHLPFEERSAATTPGGLE